MVRRRGGLVRTAARTAVIAGTARAVSGRVAQRQAQAVAADTAPPPASAAQTSQGAGEPDVVARLQQLADLKASGALTDKEFATAKARLLAL